MMAVKKTRSGRSAVSAEEVKSVLIRKSHRDFGLFKVTDSSKTYELAKLTDIEADELLQQFNRDPLEENLGKFKSKAERVIEGGASERDTQLAKRLIDELRMLNGYRKRVLINEALQSISVVVMFWMMLRDNEAFESEVKSRRKQITALNALNDKNLRSEADKEKIKQCFADARNRRPEASESWARKQVIHSFPAMKLTEGAVRHIVNPSTRSTKKNKNG